MDFVVWKASAPPWGRADMPAAVMARPAEHWQWLLGQQRRSGNGAADEDGYETYEPIQRIVVPLESAATSPFMDS
jgi:hypothetical protein